MDATMEKIREGIVELLPGAAKVEISPGTYLNHIPQWDSMTSVNFNVFLEEAFGVRVPDELLEGESTIGDVIDFLRRPE